MSARVLPYVLTTWVPLSAYVKYTRIASLALAVMTYWTMKAKTCSPAGRRQRKGREMVRRSNSSELQRNLKTWGGSDAKRHPLVHIDPRCLMLSHISECLERLLDFNFDVIIMFSGRDSNLSLDFKVTPHNREKTASHLPQYKHGKTQMKGPAWLIFTKNCIKALTQRQIFESLYYTAPLNENKY